MSAYIVLAIGARTKSFSGLALVNNVDMPFLVGGTSLTDSGRPNNITWYSMGKSAWVTDHSKVS